MMKLREALHLKRSPVVLGVFHNTDELFRACAVLTDFGYPKESARITRTESIMPVTVMPITDRGILGAMSRHLTVKKIFIVMAIISAVTIAGIALAEIPKNAWVNVPEPLLTMALWLLFFSAGSLVCMLIGFLIWALIHPLLANGPLGRDGNRKSGSLVSNIKGKITLRIKPRTSVDATDIAQAWTEIGGRVVSN
ncbi:MAG TPA: hypothetical protein PLK30_23055 [Blastocatellia bacterium]|nr:hypothetical protein [Blastocatellia bacterium]